MALEALKALAEKYFCEKCCKNVLNIIAELQKNWEDARHKSRMAYHAYRHAESLYDSTSEVYIQKRDEYVDASNALARVYDEIEQFHEQQYQTLMSLMSAD